MTGRQEGPEVLGSFKTVRDFGVETGERTQTGATPLQLALAQGQRWLRMIEAGDVSSLREIAEHDGADHSYLAKHLNLTLLAPDIVAAILDDALPDGCPAQCLAVQSASAVGRATGCPWCHSCAAEGEAGRPSTVRVG
jgi:hypothetical protein